mmetsp:Transcript_18456/g.23873  ORF Transcript_18456/g.23873 Transcript_18456/m.23873 type:complete len:393 (-) Transcript_18456:171-1349(-)
MGYLLLKHCLNVSKLGYLLRVVDPSFDVSNVLKLFDNSLHRTLEDIIATPINFASWEQCTLPVRFGGLGLQSAEMTHDLANFSSNVMNFDIVNQILQTSSLKLEKDSLAIKFTNLLIDNMVFDDCFGLKEPLQKHLMNRRYQVKFDGLLVHFSDNAREMTRLRSCSMKGSGAFLQAVPNQNFGTKFFHREFQISVAYRLGLPVNLGGNRFCSISKCSKILDKYGDHALSCAYGGDRIYRHNALRDSIFHMLRRVGFDAKLEKKGLLVDSNEKPGDIFVHSFDAGRPAAFDVTVSSSIQSSSINQASQETGFVVNAAEVRKDKKFYDKCRSQGIDFFPLAVETLGGWNVSAISIFKQIAKRKSYFDSSVYSVEQQLSVCLQRKNASMILSCLF